MAAATVAGTTTIVNAAAEPEVQGLAEMLRRMGARHPRRGHPHGRHRGRARAARRRATASSPTASRRARSPSRPPSPAAMSRCCGAVHGAPDFRDPQAARGGRHCRDRARTACGCARARPLHAVTVQALPYPGFATDLQAPMAVLLTQAQGVSYVHGARVRQPPRSTWSELRKMGARIVTTGTTDCYH